MSTPSDAIPRLVKLLPAVERAFGRWMDSLLEGGCISPARVRLLAALHCGGSQTMSSLSDELDVTPRNVTALVDGLEAEGLVRRAPHPTDRRATLVEVTAKGDAVFGQMCQPYMAKVAELFGDLPASDRQELVRLLEALLGAIRKREGAARPT
jgi:DNA-binding MarR family transcriptional regulator